MVFEDVQWTDPTTLEVFGQAVDRIPTLHVLLIVTFRPKFEAPWIGRQYVTALTINRLGQREVSAMIDGVVGNKSLEGSVREDIIERTDGIPLFVEELTKAVLEAESHRAAEHAIAVIPPPALEVPASLHASLMARLDRLGPAKEVAQIGAAIGREFSYEGLVAAVAPGPKAVLKHALERLTASGLAFRRGTPAEATYSFKHALVQDAAYDLLLKSKRQELHAKDCAGDRGALPEYQGHSARSASPPLHAGGALQAGCGVLARSRPESARRDGVDGGRCALGSRPWRDWEPAGLGSTRQIGTGVPGIAGHSLGSLSRLAGAAARGGAQARAAAGQSRPTAEASGTHAVGAVGADDVRGPSSGVPVWAEELLSAGEDLADEELLLVGHMAVMVTNFWLGNPLVVERHARAIMERYVQERHGQIVKSVNYDPKTLAGIYLPLVLWMLGYPDRAVAIVHERDSHAHSIGHPFDSGFVLTLGAWVFHYRREPEKQYACNKAIQKLARDSRLAFPLGGACAVPQHGHQPRSDGAFVRGDRTYADRHPVMGIRWRENGHSVYPVAAR